MRRALQLLAQPRTYPWIVLVVAALVLLPRLGSYGFWEPREIAVADGASRWLEREREGPDAPAGVDAKAGAAAVVEEPEEEPAAPEPQRSKPTASEAAGEPGAGEPGVSAEPGTGEAPARPARPKQPPRTASRTDPPFNERLVAFGIDHLGFSEGGARFPLALLGLLAVLAASLLGARAAGPRAGLLAGLVTLSFPLVVLESRQLTSDIAGVTGSALLVLGLVGLTLSSRWSDLIAPRRLGPALYLAGDVAAVIAGAFLSVKAGGPLLGLLPPLAGVGVGGLAWAAGSILLGPPDGVRPRFPLVVVSALSLAGAAVALGWFLDATFTLVEAQEGDRELFGWTVDAARGPLAGLGAAWKSKGDVQTPFSAVFEQLGFGLFPWVALAPFAVLRLGLVWGRSFDGPQAARLTAAARTPWAAPMLFAWVVTTWAVQTIIVRKVGPVHYPALAGIGVAIAIWLDSLIAARGPDRGYLPGDVDPVDPPPASERGSMPLLALFAFFAAVIVAKDLASAPEELTSLTASGVKYPEGAALHRWIAVFAVPFGLALAAGLFLWRGPYRLPVPRSGRELAVVIGRFGLHAAVIVGVLFAAFLAHAWLPGLAERMSSRDVLEAFRERRREGDTLGILGNLGSGPSYYAGGDYEKLDNRQELLSFLRRPSRVFALTKASELCPLHKEAAKRDFRYFVVDDENAQFLLLSNKLGAGEADHNPLTTSILRSPPTHIQKKLSATFEDQIELIGVNMPQRVGRGEMLRMTLFYKVLKPISRPWKIFVHIDAGSQRIGADHTPVRGRCAMTYFQPGDYIVDTHEVKAGDMTYPKTSYRVMTGFFVGSSGTYTNMKVVGGNADAQHRVPIGTIQVR